MSYWAAATDLLVTPIQLLQVIFLPVQVGCDTYLPVSSFSMKHLEVFLRAIYMVQLCCMRYAYDESRTRVVSCKSNLQLALDCRVQHEECHGHLKHVSKPYDNHSHRQFYVVEIMYDFLMMQAAHVIKISCDNRKQKLYHVNRPSLT